MIYMNYEETSQKRDSDTKALESAKEFVARNKKEVFRIVRKGLIIETTRKENLDAYTEEGNVRLL